MLPHRLRYRLLALNVRTRGLAEFTALYGVCMYVYFLSRPRRTVELCVCICLSLAGFKSYQAAREESFSSHVERGFEGWLWLGSNARLAE